MLFNSYAFLGFCLVTLCAYFLVLRIRLSWAKFVLAAASIFFYGYWKFDYLYILLGSIAVNFACGEMIVRSRGQARVQAALLAGGIAANLLLLGYYKYTALFMKTANSLWSLDLTIPAIVLPIGISFFTFQQIAFLADMRRQPERQLNFVDYCLFVTFFPQLIAGPIVHHREMMPQFARHAHGAFRWSNLSIGFSIFVLGLAKKVLLADGVAPYADGLFESAAAYRPDVLTAWGGALAYGLQIYFDFSAYSDMAVGLGRMFNIRLPINFHSPYKSRSIIEFWRRWHITLSRFLRQYLYIPLGGSRKGPVRRYVNLMLVMLLGGFWHGANWTFAVWGGLHGIYLIVNHGWQALRGGGSAPASRLASIMQTALTFAAVTVAWVPFRADSMADVYRILAGMAGMNGFAGSAIPSLWSEAAVPWPLHIGVLLGVVWFAPNTIEIFRRYAPIVNPDEVRDFERPVRLRWRPTTAWSLLTALLFVLCLLQFTKISPFLYFQF